MLSLQQGSYTLASFAGMAIESLFVIALFGGMAFAYLLLLSMGRFRAFRFRVPKFFAGPRTRVRIWPKKVDLRFETLPGAIPIFLGLGITGFGLFGLILRTLSHWGELSSLFGALALSFGLTSLFLTTLARAFGNTAHAVRGDALVGKVAHVSLEIPSGGVGAIAYESDGKRHTMPARTDCGSPFEKGSRVFVVGLERGVARVERL